MILQDSAGNQSCSCFVRTKSDQTTNPKETLKSPFDGLDRGNERNGKKMSVLSLGIR